MNELKGIKKTKEAGIYMIFNADDKRTYIGATRNLYKRAYRHAYELKTGQHESKEMQEDFNNGKKMWFVILEKEDENISNDDLRIREWIYMLSFDDKRFLLYNKKESPEQIKRLLFNRIVMNEVREAEKKITKNLGITMYGIRNSKSETVEHYLKRIK